MFLYFVYYTTLVTSLASGNLIEDLETVFGTKNCIEASLVSLPTSQDAASMTGTFVDTSSTQQISETNSIKHDKTVTSKIHELAQFNEVEFLYELISEEGPPHNRLFTVRLTVGDESYEGSGSSLKKAKQSAAASAFASTLYEHPPEKIKEEKILTPTVALNNVAMKLGFGVTYHLLNGKEEQAIDSYGASDEAYGKTKSFFQKLNDTSNRFHVPVEDAQISGPFTVKVTIGDLVYKGFGHTIQAARHDAALKALKDLEKQALLKNNVCTNEETYDECKKSKEALKSPISRVYEFGQKENLLVDFEIVGESGKSHKRVFVTRCKLGQFVTEGEGGSKKESKRVAAEKMLEKLPHLQSYDENAIVSGLSDKKKKKKKKKKKMLRSTSEESFVKSVTNMVSSAWSSSDKSEASKKTHKTKNNISPKDKLLEVGNNLNIPVEFSDLKQFEGSFYSVVSLGVKPPHICLGKGMNREKSHDLAAFYGIKFLHKFGLLEKTEFLQYKLSNQFDFDEVLKEEDSIVLSEKLEEKDEL